MSPTKIDILKEDLADLQKDLEWLQQNVSANDIWQNQLFWRVVKRQNDMFDYILTKGEKKHE